MSFRQVWVTNKAPRQNETFWRRSVASSNQYLFSSCCLKISPMVLLKFYTSRENHKQNKPMISARKFTFWIQNNSIRFRVWLMLWIAFHIIVLVILLIFTYPLERGSKLKVHKTFWTSSDCLLHVQFTSCTQRVCVIYTAQRLAKFQSVYMEFFDEAFSLFKMI